MLWNLENIWSESLVNSEEFAMFAVPKFYTSEMLCLYISDNRNIAGFFRCTYLFQVCRVLANRRKGSASSFMKNIINQIFRHMPKPSENLKSGDNSALTSTQPSEKGKSQSKLEKEIISIQKKVSKLQEECRHERNEKYRLLCYINRYCSALFPYFDRSNPVDSKNWEKVHRLQLDLDKEIK